MSPGVDGGTVIVDCDGEQAGSTPIFGGEQVGSVELEGCEGELGLTIEPADLEARIEAVALVVADPE